mgnify:FL=1
MKRITAATVAAATALTLAVSPAHAQETTDAPAGEQNVTAEAPATNETKAPSDDAIDAAANDNVTTEVEEEEIVETPDGTKKTTSKKTTTKPAPQKQQGGSSEGHVVAAVAGTLGAVLTTSLIVLSDPRGINKIIDALNRDFGLGLPHVYVPQVQLPNFQLPF